MTTTRAGRSIYRTLLRGTLLALLLSLLVSSVLSYLATRHEVAELFDAQLIENTRVLKGFINHPATDADWFRLQLSLQEASSTLSQLGIHQAQAPTLGRSHAYEKKLAVQVWSADARLVVRSPSAPNHALAPLKTGLTLFKGQQHDWQVYTVWLEQNHHWLVVAEQLDIRAELSLNILASVLFGMLFGFAVALWGVRRQLKIGLFPLRALGAAIQQRSVDDLIPVQLSQTPAELQPVVDELNLLLDRLQNSLSRERRFLADAAHELRTPLAVILLQVQQALSLPAAQQQAVLTKLLNSVQRNQQVVEQLLLLARLDSDMARFEPVLVAFDGLVREVAAQLVPLALLRGIELECDAQPVKIKAESALLVALLRNVLDNAIRHSPDGASIEISLSHDDAWATLKITDQGGGIPEQQVGAMLERFGQGERADRGGAGLGLAIAQ
ncbi:MAG: ATP-binding protein, partial [Pseudomonadota bacterium]|nr:ATP-binding protein [Pseudomonadota bacterium]